MKPLASMPRDMRRSGIREVMEIAGSMTDVIHFEVGEPDGGTPPEVIDAGFEAAHKGFTRYTPNAGLITLRAAIAAKLQRQNGIEAGSGNIVVTPGAVCALATSILATIDPGDEVLIPDPGWPNYLSMVQLARGVPVTYELQGSEGYIPDVAKLDRLITPRTKLIVVNSPSNPTGVVFPPATIEELVALARARDLYLLTDEVYEAFAFDSPHVPAARFDSDGRVITVFGFSKTYAMTGWRLGYAVAAEPVAAIIAKLQEPLVSCSSSIAQKAAERALAIPADEIRSLAAEYAQRRDLVVAILGDEELLAVRPSGAFYAWIDLTRANSDSYELARTLLTEERVAAAPGETFGESGRGMLRISYATSLPLLEEGCRRIARFARRHQRS